MPKKADQNNEKSESSFIVAFEIDLTQCVHDAVILPVLKKHLQFLAC